MVLNAIINEDSIGMYVGGQIRTIQKTHCNFEAVKDALKAKDIKKAELLMDETALINEYGKGKIKVEDGVVYCEGKPLHNHLTSRLKDLINEGYGVDHMVSFIKNLYLNDNGQSIEELYEFLENFALPITEDGCFLAYKAVTNGYKDIYSGKLNNRVGDVVKMTRSSVDKDRGNHCSAGLHVGAMAYVKSYGGVRTKPKAGNGNRVMIVKVNPKNAVSVPPDCSCQKLRCCEYEVISEMDNYDSLLERAVYTSDAKEKEIDDSRFISTYQKENNGNSKKEDDSVFFNGRRDGELDASSGVPYQIPVGKTKKYVRGYKLGYKRAGFDVK
jgi:hypothetical protein